MPRIDFPSLTAEPAAPPAEPAPPPSEDCKSSSRPGRWVEPFTFPLMRDGIGAKGAFWIYSVICLCGFLFFLKRLPETKGKSLEQLEQELVK